MTVYRYKKIESTTQPDHNPVKEIDMHTDRQNARLSNAARIEAVVTPASRASGTRNRQRSFLDKFAGELSALRAKGFSIADISSFLNKAQINVTGETVEAYLTHADEVEGPWPPFFESPDLPKQHCLTSEPASIEQGLQQCLDDDGDGFFLCYQPQIDMLTNTVIGAEALLRWNRSGVVVSPAEFISVAEASGLIVPIGEWVLREACREAKRWRELGLIGHDMIKMSVNLSVKQLTPELPDLIHGLLCDLGLPAEALALEITESLLVAGGSMLILRELQQSGIQLSIDDFGTGYSCLAELQDMPVSTIKIDRAFVQRISCDEASSPMVEIIIDLAHRLNMSTVAEGVETAEQVAALVRHGCTVCQGYFYEKPLLSDQFLTYVWKSRH